MSSEKTPSGGSFAQLLPDTTSNDIGESKMSTKEKQRATDDTPKIKSKEEKESRQDPPMVATAKDNETLALLTNTTASGAACIPSSEDHANQTEEEDTNVATNKQDAPGAEVEDDSAFVSVVGATNRSDTNRGRREAPPTQPGAVRVTGPGGEVFGNESVPNEPTMDDSDQQQQNQEEGLISAHLVEEPDELTIYEAEAISEELRLRKRRQRTQRMFIGAGALVAIAVAVIVAVVVSINKRRQGDDVVTQIVTVTNAPTFPLSTNPSTSPSMSPTSPITWEPFGQVLNGSAADERFGSFVDISNDGNVLAIVSGHVSSPNSIVQVYDMNRATDMWQQLGGDSLQNQTGSVVSLSKGGDVLAVGDPHVGIENGTLPGKVRIFDLQGQRLLQWVQRGGDIDGVAAGDRFGSSVSLSHDGSIVAVGAAEQLTVYAYNSSANTWDQLGQNIEAAPSVKFSDPLGSSVSLSGDGRVVAIGENGDNRVRVFEFRSSTDVWTQLGDDIVSNGYLHASNYFGTSVSLSSNGRVLASGDPVKPPGSDGSAGTSFTEVYEYIETMKEWKLRGETIDAEGTDGLGTVRLSNDGNVLAVGAPFNDGAGFASGHARVHQYDEELDSWEQIGPDIDGMAPFDEAGESIALSGDGDVLVVSARLNDDNGDNSGQVRVYRIAGGRFTPAPSISLTPSESPSTAPTFLPSYIDLASGLCRGVEFISGQENAISINFGDVCNDFEPCTAAKTVELPFTFLWFGDTPITSVAIDAGGQINIDNSLEVINGVVDTIEVGGIYTRPRIAFLKSEGILSPGSIWTLDTGNSFIISLEYMLLLHPSGFLSCDTSGQVELFPNGNIEIRMEGEYYTTMVVGIEDDTRSPPEAFQGCGPFEVRQP